MDSRIREAIEKIQTAEAYGGLGYAVHRLLKEAREALAATEPCEDAQYSYASKQRTDCAVCGERKHTPLRRDEMGGYVCLTCIDKRLDDYDVSEKILDEIKKRDAHIKQVIMWAEGCIDEAHTPDFVELSHVIESANSALYHNTDKFEHEWDAMTKEEMWNEIQDIRRLVDADGTMSICSSIESWASQVADKRAEELRSVIIETARFLKSHQDKSEGELYTIGRLEQALAATEPRPVEPDKDAEAADLEMYGAELREWQLDPRLYEVDANVVRQIYEVGNTKKAQKIVIDYRLRLSRPLFAHNFPGGVKP